MPVNERAAMLPIVRVGGGRAARLFASREAQRANRIHESEFAYWFGERCTQAIPYADWVFDNGYVLELCTLHNQEVDDAGE